MSTHSGYNQPKCTASGVVVMHVRCSLDAGTQISRGIMIIQYVIIICDADPSATLVSQLASQPTCLNSLPSAEVGSRTQAQNETNQFILAPFEDYFCSFCLGHNTRKSICVIKIRLDKRRDEGPLSLRTESSCLPAQKFQSGTTCLCYTVEHFVPI